MEGAPEAKDEAAMLTAASAPWLLENWHVMDKLKAPEETQIRFRQMLKEELDRRGIDTNIVTPFRREE